MIMKSFCTFLTKLLSFTGWFFPFERKARFGRKTKEKMKYVVRKGKTGAEEIQKIMDNFRANPPKQLGGSPMETETLDEAAITMIAEAGKL